MNPDVLGKRPSPLWVKAIAFILSFVSVFICAHLWLQLLFQGKAPRSSADARCLERQPHLSCERAQAGRIGVQVDRVQPLPFAQHIQQADAAFETPLG